MLAETNSIKSRWFILFGLGLFTAAWAESPADSEQAKEWLSRMAYAVESLNYEGVLVHLRESDADVLRIVHRVEDGEVVERITALDDSGREIIRSEQDVMCIFPDRRSVIVEKRGGRPHSESPLEGHLPQVSDIKQTLYEVRFLGPKRIAGREAQGMAIKPRDEFRYGYRLWLDRATGMPLRTKLIDGQGGIVEQMIFAEISLPERIPLSAVKPTVSLEGFSWKKPDPQASSAQEVSTTSGSWHATDLPDGFSLTAEKSEKAPGSGSSRRRHLVYSDGLASVSVFIEKDAEASENKNGASQLGGANAFSTVVDGHFVTAMGEVPVRTVQRIALSMRPADRGP